VGDAQSNGDQTLGAELVRRVLDVLASSPEKNYEIRARLLDNGFAHIAIAARSGSGEIETTSFQVRCGEAALRSAFGRIGGAEFEQHADTLTGLLGRARALAHAAVEVLSSAGSQTAHQVTS
jgi:hypothetical protein